MDIELWFMTYIDTNKSCWLRECSGSCKNSQNVNLCRLQTSDVRVIYFWKANPPGGWNVRTPLEKRGEEGQGVLLQEKF